MVATDWQAWLRRWDRQQESYLPDRDQRFAVMFDACETLLGTAFTAIDLACGPGSLSVRLLDRFPDARVVAIDIDPVLLALGRGALGERGGRLSWVEADLAGADWPARLPVATVDAVLSTTALHWLPTARIVELYGALGTLIRPGGVFLNGDRMEYAANQASAVRLADAREKCLEGLAAARGAETWDGWWAELRLENGMEEVFAERERRFGTRPRPAHTILKAHRGALLQAGFSEVETIWQQVDNRVLMAVR